MDKTCFQALRTIEKKTTQQNKPKPEQQKNLQEHRGFKKELSAKKRKGTRNSDHLLHPSRRCKTVREKEMCMNC